MLFSRFAIVAHLAALSLAPVLEAAEAKPEPTVAPVPHLGAPLVTKLDWNVRSLAIADIDGDGRQDAAVLNNDTGRIELLYQRKPGDPVLEKRSPRRDRWTPDLEDALFRRESVTGDAAMIALAVGDLNGDGLADIVFTSERSGLNVLFQGPKGEWNQRLKDNRYASAGRFNSLKIADIDGTGKSAIVQLTKDGIATWRFTGAPVTRLPEPQLYRTDGTSGNLVVTDLTGEGRLALGTLTPGEESVLRFRLAQAKGNGYGPEITLRVAATSLDLRAPLEKGPKFVAVNSRERSVNSAQLIRDEHPLDGADTTVLQTYAPPNGIGGVGQVAVLDVDGDGVEDLVVADGKAAQLLVYRGLANGDFAEPVEYPSLSGISSISPVAVSKKAGLLVLSEKEKILGYVAFDQGKPGFPVPIPLKEKPVSLANGRVGEQVLDVILTKDDKGNFAVQTLVAAEPSGSWTVKKLFDIESSRRDITGLQVADINGDDTPDILAFVDRESLRIWTQGKDGKFQEAAKDSAYRKSILDGVTPADIGWGVVDDTGKPALLVATQGYIRALRLDDKDELEVIFQANSRRPSDRLRAPLTGKFSGKGVVLLVCNETDKSLEWLERDDAGVFRTRQTITLDPISPLEAWTQPVASEKTPRLVYVTKERLVQIPTARRGLRVELKSLYETDLTGFRPMASIGGDFNGTGSKGIVLIDPRSHILELIQADSGKQWSSALHFTLYDENPHYRGRRSTELQPREFYVADLTGDGLVDLVLLMHDRLFIYPQQQRKKE